MSVVPPWGRIVLSCPMDNSPGHMRCCFGQRNTCRSAKCHSWINSMKHFLTTLHNVTSPSLHLVCTFLVTVKGLTFLYLWAIGSCLMGCNYLMARVHALNRSVVSNSLWPPWTVAHQAPLSVGFPRQEFWSGLPFPPPGNLPNPGIEPASSALAGRVFTAEPPQKPNVS